MGGNTGGCVGVCKQMWSLGLNNWSGGVNGEHIDGDSIGVGVYIK